MVRLVGGLQYDIHAGMSDITGYLITVNHTLKHCVASLGQLRQAMYKQYTLSCRPSTDDWHSHGRPLSHSRSATTTTVTSAVGWALFPGETVTMVIAVRPVACFLPDVTHSHSAHHHWARVIEWPVQLLADSFPMKRACMGFWTLCHTALDLSTEPGHSAVTTAESVSMQTHSQTTITCPHSTHTSTHTAPWHLYLTPPTPAVLPCTAHLICRHTLPCWRPESSASSTCADEEWSAMPFVHCYQGLIMSNVQMDNDSVSSCYLQYLCIVMHLLCLIPLLGRGYCYGMTYCIVSDCCVFHLRFHTTCACTVVACL